MCGFCGKRDHSLFGEGTTYISAEVVNAPAKPTYTVDQIADYLTDGYWEDTGQARRAFVINETREITVDLTGLTSSAQIVAREALEAWEALSGLNFVEQTSGAVDINFGDADESGAYNSSISGFGRIYYASINIPTGWAIYGEDYYLQTYIHEIGHALGLGHGGLYNGSGTYDEDADYTNDSWQMSVMSYFSQNAATEVDADFAYVATPQIADIAAIQDLYGVPTNVETGNTTYGDGNTTGRDIMGMDHGYAFTIVDSGGIDAINLGSRSHNQNLSLVFDAFSDINGKTGNFANGRGTVTENAITGSGNDTITGNAAKNELTSGSGNDLVFGGAGDDTLDGGTGNDILHGGSGRDVYFVDSLNDRIVENAGQGIDRVFASSSFSLSSSSQHLENLILTGTSNTHGVGNARNNTIGGNSGDNRLNGAWGNDRLVGGAGNDLFRDYHGDDTMIGGTGNDTYHVDSTGDRVREQAGEGQDHVISKVDFSLAAHSDHIEVLTLTGAGSNPDGNGIGSISGTGNLQDNLIYGSDDAHNHLSGGAGNDTVVGRSQNDWLTGGQGADRMAGRLGNDVYEVDNIGDRIIEHTGQGEDLVNSSISFSLADSARHVKNLTLTGTADINGIGNWHDNIIAGNDGGNLLTGGWGNDQLFDQGGKDTINGDGSNDQMSGGADADTFVFSGNFGVDRIVDFDVNEIGETISLAGFQVLPAMRIWLQTT